MQSKAAFSLFDYNGDGYISLEEMTRYLASVFKVMYETQPGTAEQMGVSAEDLATVTAEQAFEDADLNHDGAYHLKNSKNGMVNHLGKVCKKLLMQRQHGLV